MGEEESEGSEESEGWVKPCLSSAIVVLPFGV